MSPETTLREEIWEQILPKIQQRRVEASMAGEDVEAACRAAADSAIRAHEAQAIDIGRHWLDESDLAWLWHQVESLMGSGPLEHFLRRPDVENIYVFGPSKVVLSLASGRQEHHDEPLFAYAAEKLSYISHVANTQGQTGRRFDLSEPMLDLRLKTGERVFAAMAVCNEPYLTVRCHRHRAVDLEGLVEAGSLSGQAAEFLRAAVAQPAPANVLVCGALGAGKTTLLRALLSEIGETEIVCTLEQTFELFLDESHPLTFAVETRDANSDGSGEITMDELARRSLRSGADRVIVGELRGAEAAVFLSACGTGSDGSMATIHAASTRQALSRLVRYCMRSTTAGLQSVLVQEAADVIHLVVFVRRDPRSGRRVVATISEVLGAEGEQFQTHDIFTRPQRSDKLVMVDEPRNPDLLARLAESGLDLSRRSGTDHTNSSFRSGSDHSGSDHAEIGRSDNDHANNGRSNIDRSDIDRSDNDHANNGRSNIDRSNIDRSDIGRADTDRASNHRASNGHASIDRPDNDHSDIDRPGNDHSDIDRPSNGRSDIGRSGGDRPDND
ncbi:MAG: ATPase, T2SS/T4P/T4SS family, partial [Acidimicrobiaceae bacterium]|nr:ATPase, T2SS/T4P/T4SS family [Acidimicrobiaceae bacterium]